MASTKLYDDETLFAFSTQLSLIYESGIPLSDGLTLLKSQNTVLPMERLIEEVKRHGKLSKSLQDDPRFPYTFVQALSVAESIGQEDSVAKHLAHYYQRKHENRLFLKDILFMPLILLSILIVVMGVLSIAVLPIFEDVYSSLGGTNPVWVDLILKVVQVVSFAGLALLALAIGWIIFIALRHKMDPSKQEDVIESLLRLFPESKYRADIARFSFITQLLLSSGIDNHQALKLAQDQVLPGKLLTQLKATSEHFNANEGLHELLQQAKIYPPLLQNTLELASKAGKLDITMEILSQKMQIEAENSLSATLNRIEPILVVALTIFVSTVLFSLIVPLLGVMSVIGA